jgi:hypothetical protein
MEAVLKEIQHELGIHGDKRGVGKPRKKMNTSPPTSSNHSIIPGRTTTNSVKACQKVTKEVPQVTLIREILAPPLLPKPVVKILESVLSYQNAGQCHMALGALDECKSLYNEYK